MIRKRKNKWVIVSKHTGKVLGTFRSKKAANKRLQQMHYFKMKNAK